jgi:DUF971 family protein
MELQLHAHECLPTCRNGKPLAQGTALHHSGSQCCVSPASCQAWSLCGSTGMTPAGHCKARIMTEAEHRDSHGCILFTWLYLIHMAVSYSHDCILFTWLYLIHMTVSYSHDCILFTWLYLIHIIRNPLTPNILLLNGHVMAPAVRSRPVTETAHV